MNLPLKSPKNEKTPQKTNFLIDIIPVCIAGIVLLFPSIWGHSRLDYINSGEFTYPIINFFGNLDSYSLVSTLVYLAGIGLFLVKKYRWSVKVSLVLTIPLWIFLLITCLVASAMSFTTVKSISYNQHTYHLTSVAIRKPNAEEMGEFLYYHTVNKCDSLSLICTTPFNYVSRVLTEWNMNTNGSFDLIIREEQLLLIYQFDRHSGKMEVVQIIAN